MKRIIEGVVYGAKQALYRLSNAKLYDCVFAGAADAEAALQEAQDITMENCIFSRPHPLWDIRNFRMTDSRLTEGAQEPLLHAENGKISDSDIDGSQALRACRNITLDNCDIHSPDFGWNCQDIRMEDCGIRADHLFRDSRNVSLRNDEMRGECAFQHMENLEIRNSFLNGRDAFWHSKNVTVVDSVLRGEHLGWYSENLTLIGCRIIGTQPLRSCTGLKVIECTLEGFDGLPEQIGTELPQPEWNAGECSMALGG